MVDDNIATLAHAIVALAKEIKLCREMLASECSCGGSDKLATQHNLDELESKLEGYISRIALGTETKILKAIRDGYTLSPIEVEVRNEAAELAIRASLVKKKLEEQLAKAEIILGEGK